MDEIWKDVKGFEGVYQISNHGRLISLKRGSPYILSNENSKGDYLSVVLSYKGNTRYVRIHVLVYEAFIGEIPKGFKYHIHHIDHNKQNNRYDNLILVNSKEHRLIHSTINQNIIQGMINYNKYIRPKKICQYTLDGDFIQCFNNAHEASINTGVCQRNILQVANKTPFNKYGNVRKQAGGFIWKTKED